ncbi:MAG: phosphatase PAP2 family protein [Alphaproteobacteria bacterium]
MLLLLSAAFLVAGLAAFPFDRRVAEYFRRHKKTRWRRNVRRTTDWAKGAHWLIIGGVLFIGAHGAMALGYESAELQNTADVAGALLLSLLFATISLHTIKIFVGRRRPRDHFQHGLYGFEFFRFETQHDSFPSGHALTIFCVATVASGAWPALTPIWFTLAFLLALTRALLASHFLSDVLIGAALGLIVSRQTMLLFFPSIAPVWF